VSPFKTAVERSTHSFDYYVRSVTTSLLALGIVGGLLYTVLARGHAPQLLIGWGGIIIGVYFGYHVTANGIGVKRQVSENTLSSVMHAAEAIQHQQPGPEPPPAEQPPPTPPAQG
jgi:hypothetical protein